MTELGTCCAMLLTAVVASCATPPPTVAATAMAPPSGPDGIATLRSMCGFLFVANDGPLHATLELTGDRLDHRREGETDLFMVDDLAVQIQVVTRDKIGASAAGKAGLALLRAHEAWEVAYLSDKALETIRPIETETAFELRDGARLPGLVWRFDLPATIPAAAGITGATYATVEVEGRVLLLSAQATNGMPSGQVAAHLTQWMRTASLSKSYLSVEAIQRKIKARVAAGESCSVSGARGSDRAEETNVDRRLRLDDVPEDQKAFVRDVSARTGGVERRRTGGRLEYRNNICRFEVDYPDGFQDFTVQDFNGKTCMLNLVTPEVHDRDDGQNITNAVVVSATLKAPGYGRDQFHEQMVSGLRKQGARFHAVNPPLMKNGLHERYEVEGGGQKFAGETVTFEAGQMIYNVWFNATPGTIAEGRKNFLSFMGAARWNLARTP